MSDDRLAIFFWRCMGKIILNPLEFVDIGAANKLSS
jgi:hypothetical protein